MSIVNSVVAADSDYLKLQEATKTQSEMDKDAFINLLVTQMKYQDPMEPMENTEMLAQLAQFTALEQMLNVAQTNQKQLANSMIGKYVEYQYIDSISNQTTDEVGKVDYVKLSGDTPILGIGDKEIELDKVYQVVDTNNIQTSSTAFDVIDKTIQAKYAEKGTDGKDVESVIEGKVLSVEMDKNEPYVIIGTGDKSVKIPFKNSQGIIQTPSITGRQITATTVDSNGNSETVSGEAEYIKITSAGTEIYVNGKFVNFTDIKTVK
ncbi:flagellar hook assembly protein FlgD [Cellulosilyticum ruminicola]|uniref:flagellar hook assembly protein FlgD n=1 Tax=Cellulosilyticum ruminicola TaxID=425254 RepID=UPI0006D0F929|nr:flagellar hook capping FlgD N-terminal domain-containing protein [Cellulosilyticum ruminicola]